MSLPWILIQYGPDGAAGPTNGTIAGPPPWVLIGYGTSGAAVVPIEPTHPPISGGGIASSIKRKPAVYVDGFRRVRKELASQQVETLEVKPETAAPQPVAPFVPLLLDKLIADQPVSPADELRAREIERQLQMMRDDDEAIALLLLN